MLNEDRLWEAVASRDVRWDGVFVYAVKSTGIYCRPGCPSRRPGRGGVSFFAAPAAAEQAGFRPCRRCRPGDAAAAPPAIDRIKRVCTAIARRPDVPVSLGLLAKHVSTSPHHLLRTFKKILGVSPREYRDACREGCLRASLRSGASVTDATYEAGYGSGSRVYERADAVLGMTPGTYAAGGPGVGVRYAVVDSALGKLLVAATDRGICRVSLGDHEEAMSEELRREYPKAACTPADEPLRGWIAQVVASLAPGMPDARVPIDIRATAFQRMVWRALQEVPRGETRTYADIAKAIGRTAATRAVARACATNPVALIVPCHRVVRTDGSLGGYRWGLDRKRALLRAEGGERGLEQ